MGISVKKRTEAEHLYYRVKIEQVVEIPTIEKEYKIIAQSGNERDGKEVYAYVPEKSTTTESITILEQEIKDIDISKVIAAINGLAVP